MKPFSGMHNEFLLCRKTPNQHSEHQPESESLPIYAE